MKGVLFYDGLPVCFGRIIKGPFGDHLPRQWMGFGGHHVDNDNEVHRSVIH